MHGTMQWIAVTLSADILLIRRLSTGLQQELQYLVLVGIVGALNK